MKWTWQHYLFFVEVYVRNGNSVVTREQLLCTCFSIHHDYILSWNAIKAQAQNFWGRASVFKRKPQGKVPMVWTPKNTQVWEVQSVQQGGITLPCTTWSKCSDFWTKIFIFILTKLKFFENWLWHHKLVFFWGISQTDEWWCCYQHYPNDKPHFHLSQYVNKQNDHYWAPKISQWLNQYPPYSKKLTVCSWVTSFGVDCPYLFEHCVGSSSRWNDYISYCLCSE
jgi:hypothetical protein